MNFHNVITLGNQTTTTYTTGQKNMNGEIAKTILWQDFCKKIHLRKIIKFMQINHETTNEVVRKLQQHFHWFQEIADNFSYTDMLSTRFALQVVSGHYCDDRKFIYNLGFDTVIEEFCLYLTKPIN